MKKNDSFELEITDLSDDGAGIGRREGYVWFVKDTVPGDYVEAAVTKEKKNYGFARLVRVITPSPDRTDPACPIARQCGGCQLQAMNYAAQLRFKERKVLGNLRRIGGFEIGEDKTGQDKTGGTASAVTVEPVIGMEHPFRYRNKAQYPIGKNKDGRIIAGFYAGRTHSIIACTDCLLGCTENRSVLECIIGWMTEYGIEPYEEENGRGMVRHVLIRKGNASGQIMVCLVINAKKLPGAEALTEKLLLLNETFRKAGEPAVQITSISYNINQEATNVILGRELVNLYGPGYIEDSIRRLCVDPEDGSFTPAAEPPVRFRISPLAFYQVNPGQMERLYSTALEYAGLTGRETVWDVYCGIGTISLFLARHAKKVYGVEVIPQAIDNARENAIRNGFENVEFFVGKAEEVLPAWYEKTGENRREKIDVVVVDPPRKGCDEKCLETIVKLAPERIVYVSCDSATLARDLRFLCQNGYALRKVRACDMFGQTVHVETVCLLSKLKVDHHIEIELRMDELDLTSAESKATYDEIKSYVLEKYGLKVSQLYIAQVKRKCGIIERKNYNVSKKEDAKVPQCPPEKEAAIMDALKHFQMI
ncbi:MAG: 23S rRNA (uracil(1939)-C(5))-methyltransferase RlmD [Eubacteriales bacterium]|nr:23S rRNA (uracil(1939)-C(5))-methyltransferase RlmD [Eubacteriales bacterium]